MVWASASSAVASFCSAQSGPQQGEPSKTMLKTRLAGVMVSISTFDYTVPVSGSRIPTIEWGTQDPA